MQAIYWGGLPLSNSICQGVLRLFRNDFHLGSWGFPFGRHQLMKKKTKKKKKKMKKKKKRKTLRNYHAYL